MGHRKIRIKGIKSGDQLVLSNNGNAEVESDTKYRNVVWTIRTEAVSLIRIEGKSPDNNPFEGPIPTEFRSRVKLRVRDNEPPKDWEYVIYWIDSKDGSKHCHDPKIAIRSSKNKPEHDWSWQHWLGLSLGLLGVALWLTGDKKKGK